MKWILQNNQNNQNTLLRSRMIEYERRQRLFNIVEIGKTTSKANVLQKQVKLIEQNIEEKKNILFYKNNENIVHNHD